MLTGAASKIRAIVFDLDGTLYVNEPFAATIQAAAVGYVAGLKGIASSDAADIMASARQRLIQEGQGVPTLSAVCADLGGDIQSLHGHFQTTLNPEAFLVCDERVVELLRRLAQSYALYIYTNNNRFLTDRITGQLGLDGLFRHIFTIDDSWQGKPDRQMLIGTLNRIGLTAPEVLFVGDRYDVDLRVPKELGCPVYLTRSVEELLQLEGVLC